MVRLQAGWCGACTVTRGGLQRACPGCHSGADPAAADALAVAPHQPCLNPAHAPCAGQQRAQHQWLPVLYHCGHGRLARCEGRWLERVQSAVCLACQLRCSGTCRFSAARCACVSHARRRPTCSAGPPFPADNKHVVFGRVLGDGMLTVRKLEAVATGPNNRPKLPCVVAQVGPLDPCRVPTLAALVPLLVCASPMQLAGHVRPVWPAAGSITMRIAVRPVLQCGEM